jgi:spore maturation protein CgeB
MSGMRIVFLGLSITSSWGNGHATTYRGLIKGLLGRGHRVSFLERDCPWYAAHRDPLSDDWGRVYLYNGLSDLKKAFTDDVTAADAVIVGSYVPQGSEVLRWVLETARGLVAFYDIDTPITVARLTRGDHEYIDAALLPRLDLYLSFTGGPILDHIRQSFGVRRAVPLYCAVDPEVHFPEPCPPRWDLGYLGTYSTDRQPKLELLLNAPARRLPDHRFVVAGPQYPPDIHWPPNVERVEHLPPHRHRHFYSSARFTLNITRADMVAAGWSPSVRLFEAAACGVPIISDDWPGLATIFAPGDEIFIAPDDDQVVDILAGLTEERRRRLATAALCRVLDNHTAACRARELENHLLHPDSFIPTEPWGRGAADRQQYGGTSCETAGPRAP